LSLETYGNAWELYGSGVWIINLFGIGIWLDGM
jgi:hypothetical protein